MNKVFLNVNDEVNEKNLYQVLKKEKWGHVTRVRKNSLKGSMDIKKHLYKDVYNPCLYTDTDNFTKEDYEMLSRYEALMKIESKVKSFLPNDLLKKLATIENEVKLVYGSMLVYPEMNYMTGKDFKSFSKLVIKKQAEIELNLQPYCDHWNDAVVEPFVEGTLKKLFTDMDINDINLIVSKIPSPEGFMNSYKNYYQFEYQELSKGSPRLTTMGSSLKKISPSEALKDDVETLIACNLQETIILCCNAHRQCKLGSFIRPSTRTAIKNIGSQLSRSLKFLKNSDLDELISISFELSDAIHDKKTEAMNQLNTILLAKAYQIMKNYNLLEKVGLPIEVSEAELEAL